VRQRLDDSTGGVASKRRPLARIYHPRFASDLYVARVAVDAGVQAALRLEEALSLASVVEDEDEKAQ
jgi:hypothetical protein